MARFMINGLWIPWQSRPSPSLVDLLDGVSKKSFVRLRLLELRQGLFDELYDWHKVSAFSLSSLFTASHHEDTGISWTSDPFRVSVFCFPTEFRVFFLARTRSARCVASALS